MQEEKKLGKVSIIVPVYNTPEEYLNLCVNSILAQTYTDFELLIVDDGSRIECSSLLDSWSKKDERIRVIYKENGGVSSARNHGIDEAKGEFILFVDSDDAVTADWLRVAVELAQQEAADLVIGDVIRCSAAECSRLVKSETSSEVHIFDERNIWKVQSALLLRGFRMKAITEPIYWTDVGSWAKLFRKTCIKDERFDTKLYYCEDQVFNHAVIRHSKRIVYNKSLAYCYVQNAGSVVHTYDPNRQKVVVQFLQEIRNMLPDDKRVLNAFYGAVLHYVDSRAVLSRYSSDGRMSIYETYQDIKETLEFPVFNEAKNNINFNLFQKSVKYIRCWMICHNMIFTAVMIQRIWWILKSVRGVNAA